MKEEFVLEKKLTGVVSWFSDRLGYGFITPESDVPVKDIFVHFSGVNMKGFKTLAAGDKVTFVIEKGEKGVQAANVVKAE